MSDPHVPVPAAQRVIGRDIGPAGRLVRILAGLFFVAAAIAGGVFAWASVPTLAEVALTFLAAGAFYTILIWLLGDRLLARANPWLVAVAMVIPLGVTAAPFVPAPVAVGADLYLGVSMLVQAAIGYGGCEIAGIPTLLLRRRYTVYCALNGADVVEQWLQGRRRWVAWTLALVAFVVTMMAIAVVELVGRAVGFFGAYVAFLLIGFAVSRILGSRPRHRVGVVA
ncbi:MAG: DUF6410 domain-containing protein [Candidatus Dormiibacterota bacterium]